MVKNKIITSELLVIGALGVAVFFLVKKQQTPNVNRQIRETYEPRVNLIPDDRKTTLAQIAASISEIGLITENARDRVKKLLERYVANKNELYYVNSLTKVSTLPALNMFEFITDRINSGTARIRQMYAPLAVTINKIAGVVIFSQVQARQGETRI
jgi:hypothetical protein